MSSQNSTQAADTSSADAEGFTFSLYHYTPSLAAAIAAIIVFAVLTGYHVFLITRHRSWYFTAFTLGGLFQTLGYAGRAWSHYDTTALGGYIMQAILILVAPALYAASIYMILARLIGAINGEPLSIIPVRWMTKIFVTGDVISFFLQGGGGGIQAGGTLDLYNLGEKIIIVGLFVQIVIFSFFMGTTIAFHVKVAKRPTSAAVSNAIAWQRHLYVLYTTSILILVRSIFRVIEYLQGNGGYLISHEAYLYIFDAFLMAAVMAIFAVWYIGDLKHHSGQVKENSMIIGRRGHP
ncbi:RTA1 like protein-domain-containing protein [Dactylonectria estremocensis]|uniref:RTA1 like protein-domain-containing protein n=1 Tax=Dactylonectria estremocensis TaxID=1079267 RepID=A0A9P9JBQ6_9HYPO|nr:RTA1 like protein-domain-containing protein [Dactylonectria estremocensis]